MAARKRIMKEGDGITIEKVSNGYIVTLNINDTDGTQISTWSTICATFSQVITAIEKYSNEKVIRLEEVKNVLPKV